MLADKRWMALTREKLGKTNVENYQEDLGMGQSQMQKVYLGHGTGEGLGLRAGQELMFRRRVCCDHCGGQPGSLA